MTSSQAAKVDKTASLNDLRSDLRHQLQIPDELDWDYFLETAIRAKTQADIEDRNMPDLVISIDEIIASAKEQQNR